MADMRDKLRVDTGPVIAKAIQDGDRMYAAVARFLGMTGEAQAAPFELPAVKRQPTLWGDNAPEVKPVEYPQVSFEQQQTAPDPDNQAFMELFQRAMNSNVSAPQATYRNPGVSTEAAELLRNELAAMQVPEKKEWTPKANGGDISPLVKLIDTWTGSNFSSVYRSPAQQEREAAITQIQMNQALNADRDKTQAGRLKTIMDLSNALSNVDSNRLQSAYNQAQISLGNAGNSVRAQDSNNDNLVRAMQILGAMVQNKERLEARQIAALSGKGGQDPLKFALDYSLDATRDATGLPNPKNLGNAIQNLYNAYPDNPYALNVAIAQGLLNQPIPEQSPTAAGRATPKGR